ncbi:MAG: MarR family transcriptional regulator [Pseudomonadota bacterium]
MVEEDEPIGRLIYLTAQDIRNIAEKILNPYNLTVEQFLLLKNISIESGVIQKALGKIVNKTPANLTRILDRLEIKALIIRKPDSNDRRAYLVFLTDKGMDLVTQVHETFQSVSDQMLIGISPEIQKTVRTCLKTIVKNIEQMTIESKKETL